MMQHDRHEKNTQNQLELTHESQKRVQARSYSTIFLKVLVN